MQDLERVKYNMPDGDGEEGGGNQSGGNPPPPPGGGN